MNPPPNDPARWFRSRILLKAALVVGLTAGVALIWRIYGPDDRYTPVVSHALKALPKIRNGILLEGVLCRLGLAEDAVWEDQELYPKSRMNWYRYRIAPGFVIECDCYEDSGDKFASENAVVTGVLIRQEVRGADGRVYYSNLHPSWGEPSNGRYNMQEKLP